MRIYDILPVGEENAIPGEEIERRLGITRRERRAMAAAQCGDQTTLDPPGDGTR